MNSPAFVLTDGKNYLTFPLQKTTKENGEGDQGLNTTGGMGAISPVPFSDKQFKKYTTELLDLQLRDYKKTIFLM